MSPAAAPKPRSLLEFHRDLKREQMKRDCKVCALPDVILAEIKAARGKKVRREDVIEWLNRVHRRKFTNEDFILHTHGHHDER